MSEKTFRVVKQPKGPEVAALARFQEPGSKADGKKPLVHEEWTRLAPKRRFFVSRKPRKNPANTRPRKVEAYWVTDNTGTECRFPLRGVEEREELAQYAIMSIGKDGTATLTPVDRVLKFQREFRKHGTEVERPQLDRVNRMKQWHAKWHQQATSGASLTFQEQEEEAARRRRSTPNASAAGGAVDAADVMGKTPYGEGERSGAGVDSDQASTYTDADEDDFRRSDDEAEVVDTGGPGSMYTVGADEEEGESETESESEDETGKKKKKKKKRKRRRQAWGGEGGPAGAAGAAFPVSRPSKRALGEGEGAEGEPARKLRRTGISRDRMIHEIQALGSRVPMKRLLKVFKKDLRGADKKPDPFARNRFMDILRDVCLKVKDDATGQEMYQLKPELMNT